MPYFYKKETRQRAEDFKAKLCELAEVTRTKQESIASAIGIGQPTVNHWMDVDSDRHMPAALVTQLPGEMAREVLQYLAVQLNVRMTIQTNGMIEDEVTDLSDAVGSFIRMFREDRTRKTELRILANNMRTVIDRLVAEVESK